MASFFISAAGNNANNGTSTGTPWQTIEGTGLNAKWASINSGDTISFRKGDTFYGEIIVGKSGASAATPIILNSYGAGANAVISGFTQVTSWTSAGGNKWTSPVLSNGSLTTVDMLTIDGVYYAKGRYPKLGSEGNNGWRTIDSGSTLTLIKDAATNGTTGTNWAGSGWIIRPNAWKIEKKIVATHSGINLTPNTSLSGTTNPKIGYGFFFQDPSTAAQIALCLSQHGDWYYDNATKKVTIWTTLDPNSNYVIKVSTRGRLIQCVSRNHIRVDGLRIEGANEWGTYHYNALGNQIINSEVVFCGYDGVHGRQAANADLFVDNCTIHEIGDFGVNGRDATGPITVTNNSIYNIGMYAGMGSLEVSTHKTGVVTTKANPCIVSNNLVYNCGYVGMKPAGPNMVVERNIVHDYCNIVDDGAGIYSSSPDATTTGKFIRNNLVWNGIGAPEGANGNSRANGIYIDDTSRDYTIYENYAWNGSKYGLYVHNSVNPNVHDNLFYNFPDPDGVVLFSHDTNAYPDISSAEFKNNEIWILDAAQHGGAFWSFDTDQRDFFAAVSDANNNYWIRPVPAPSVKLIFGIVNLFHSSAPLEIRTVYTLPEWRTYTSGWEANSKEYSDIATKVFSFGTDPLTITRIEYNDTNVDKIVNLGSQSYRDGKGNVYYGGNLTVAPRTAIALVASDDVAPAPIKIMMKNGKVVMKNGNIVVKTG